jgi:RimJ/RimL family protein N-acetyltransferase
MRAAVLSFALGTLGAEHATTEAFEDNAASIAVTRRLGYRPDGEDRLVRQGRPVRSLRFRLRAEGFSSPWPVRVEGWSAACATAFGLVGEA